MVPPLKLTMKERLVRLKQELRFRLRYLRCRRGVKKSIQKMERRPDADKSVIR